LAGGVSKKDAKALRHTSFTRLIEIISWRYKDLLRKSIFSSIKRSSSFFTAGEEFVRIMIVGLLINGKNYATVCEIAKKDTNRRDNLKSDERQV
jgi:hypothetical protein